MASKVIKGGTVVTADLSYEADVKIEGGKIVEIGPNLSGDETLDATGCYVMPGGIDPHTHLEMPFMGTFSSDNFDSGTRAALSGGTTMVVDFALPSPGQGLLEAIQMWDNKSTMAHCDYSFHMAITWWDRQVFEEMPRVVDEGINTFKHFMAYKGALMVNDEEMFASFTRVGDLGGVEPAEERHRLSTDETEGEGHLGRLDRLGDLGVGRDVDAHDLQATVEGAGDVERVVEQRPPERRDDADR